MSKILQTFFSPLPGAFFPPPFFSFFINTGVPRINVFLIGSAVAFPFSIITAVSFSVLLHIIFAWCVRVVLIAFFASFSRNLVLFLFLDCFGCISRRYSDLKVRISSQLTHSGYRSWDLLLNQKFLLLEAVILYGLQLMYLFHRHHFGLGIADLIHKFTILNTSYSCPMISFIIYFVMSSKV